MKFKIIILSIFLALTFSSCNVKNVNVGIPNNIEISEFNMQKIKLKINLPIDNPNNFSFTIKNADLNFIVNGISLGKINKIDKFKIDANSRNEYPIFFEIITKDAVTNIISLYPELQKKNPNIEINGYLKVSKMGVPMKIKINHTQNINF